MKSAAFFFLTSFVLLLCRSNTAAASEAWSHQCDHVSGTFNYSWCVDEPVGSQRSHLLYYFHGYSGNAESWSKSEAARVLESEAGGRDISVISVSLGSAWLLTTIDHSDPQTSRLLPKMAEDVMPEIERRLHVRSPIRDLRGDSMGRI